MFHGLCHPVDKHKADNGEGAVRRGREGQWQPPDEVVSLNCRDELG